jgi:endonuclease/exonuclease/phosphatase family metal-dependent hydrolase
MKLLTLNIWGGHVLEPLLHFIKRQQDIDILCLQEVYHDAIDRFSNDDRSACLNIFSTLQTLLPNHESFFRPVIGKASGNAYGICTFVKREIAILDEGDVCIHHNPDYPVDAPKRLGPQHSRNLQWVMCKKDNAPFTVINVHGLWNGQGKSDTPERLAQAHVIRNFTDAITTPKILCGDFNLRPETQSLAIIQKGMHNLIEKYHIATTRTHLYSKCQQQPFADYVFTSSQIAIHHFEVLPDVVSDHAPLFLDFTV